MSSQLHGPVTLPQGKELALPVAQGRGEPKSQSGTFGGTEESLAPTENRITIFCSSRLHSGCFTA